MNPLGPLPLALWFYVKRVSFIFASDGGLFCIISLIGPQYTAFKANRRYTHLEKKSNEVQHHDASTSIQTQTLVFRFGIL